MTKQDEIREGIAQTIKDDAAGYVHLMDYDRDRISKSIVSYLHSQGVVLKVARELPKDWYVRTCCRQMVKQFNETGFEAVEPLIKEVMPSATANKL